MELKDYQLAVIQDLATYLDTLLVQCNGELNTAFSQYWFNKGVANQKYKNNISNVPHVCVKVPTAGGKTFIFKGSTMIIDICKHLLLYPSSIFFICSAKGRIPNGGTELPICLRTSTILPSNLNVSG